MQNETPETPVTAKATTPSDETQEMAQISRASIRFDAWSTLITASALFVYLIVQDNSDTITAAAFGIIGSRALCHLHWTRRSRKQQ